MNTLERQEFVKKYKELAEEYEIVLRVVSETIPEDIVGGASEYALKTEDYRTIASGLFIEAHINRKGNGNGKYEGPATDAAKKFLKILISERKGATNVVESFKDANGIEDLEEISATHCSTLIDMLKTLKKA